MVQFINWSSGEIHPWGAGAQPSAAGELKSGLCPMLAWGWELCPRAGVGTGAVAPARAATRCPWCPGK